MTPIAIVGAGIAGLFAAAELHRNGIDAVLIDRTLGGRTTSKRFDDGSVFNQGPHALYAEGHCIRELRRFGIELRGGPPAGTMMLSDEQGLHPMPFGLPSLARCGALPWRSKTNVLRLLAKMPKARADQTLEHWLDEHTGGDEAKRFFAALFRLATYGGAPERMPASLAVSQFKLALKGVVYLDGGWQQLVDALSQKLNVQGPEDPVRWEKARVKSISRDAAGFAIDLGGRTLRAKAVILATPPKAASQLMPSLQVPSTSVHAACLDVLCNHLPNPKLTFALGLEQPLYYSVHSAAAALANPGHHLLHVMKYLGPEDAPEGADVEAQLWDYLQTLQPGIRAHTLRSRLLPHIPVHHGSVRQDTPRPKCETVTPGLFLAGDWVDPRTDPNEDLPHLADAACASGLRAAHLAAQSLQSIAA